MNWLRERFAGIALYLRSVPPHIWIGLAIGAATLVIGYLAYARRNSTATGSTGLLPVSSAVPSISDPILPISSTTGTSSGASLAPPAQVGLTPTTPAVASTASSGSSSPAAAAAVSGPTTPGGVGLAGKLRFIDRADLTSGTLGASGASTSAESLAPQRELFNTEQHPLAPFAPLPGGAAGVGDTSLSSTVHRGYFVAGN